MKKLCFIELEGVLAPLGNYSPNERRAAAFASELIEFCGEKKIELFLVSGHHADFAKKRASDRGFTRLFDEKHFLFVDEGYISQKAETDKALHREGLKKDPAFTDSYFKQVAVEKVLAGKKLKPKDALLLSDDLWVDGYYTTRFSKIDFALFEENLLDRGKPAQPVSGLAYFSLEFSSARRLLENFPKVEFAALDRHVFETMKKALIGDNVIDVIKKGMMKKNENN